MKGIQRKYELQRNYEANLKGIPREYKRNRNEIQKKHEGNMTEIQKQHKRNTRFTIHDNVMHKMKVIKMVFSLDRRYY